MDADPGLGVATLNASGLSDAYIVVLDQDGAYRWAYQYGTAGEESVIRLNANQISGNASLTVQSGKNGMTAGPISIATGSTLTIETGANWHLVGA